MTDIKPKMIAGKSCYVRADLVTKIEVGQRGLDWFVLCYLNTPNDTLQANMAYLAGPYDDEREATEVCDRIVDDLGTVVSVHRGGGAAWAWHEDGMVRS
jgi:hypothetical protein